MNYVLVSILLIGSLLSETIVTIKKNEYTANDFYKEYGKKEWEESNVEQKKELVEDFINRRVATLEATNIGLQNKPDIAKKLAYLPGVGQFYNKDYLKGFALLASELYSISQIVKFSKPIEGVINISKRNTFIWWAVGIYFYSVIDAHVESELSSFPDEKNVLDEGEE